MRLCSYIHFIVALFAFPNTDTVKTVPSVDLNRYAGKWYEIARYTLWFEKGMDQVTAEYILQPNKKWVKVINSGYKNGHLKNIVGKAFISDSTNSKLRVQFFWPFRGDYWIIDLAEDYSWAVVSDRKKSSLWILSRTPQLDEAILDQLMDKLMQLGYDKDRIYFTKQN